VSIVQVRAQLPTDELLRAVGQLSQPELERFVDQLLALRAQRRVPAVSQKEADLLHKINQGIPKTIQIRYDELIEKRQAETLTPEEHQEILGLTETIEGLETERLEYLTELAELRNVTLRHLMAQLGIRTPAYA